MVGCVIADMIDSVVDVHYWLAATSGEVVRDLRERWESLPRTKVNSQKSPELSFNAYLPCGNDDQSLPSLRHAIVKNIDDGPSN